MGMTQEVTHFKCDRCGNEQYFEKNETNGRENWKEFETYDSDGGQVKVTVDLPCFNALADHREDWYADYKKVMRGGEKK